MLILVGLCDTSLGLLLQNVAEIPYFYYYVISISTYYVVLVTIQYSVVLGCRNTIPSSQSVKINCEVLNLPKFDSQVELI